MTVVARNGWGQFAPSASALVACEIPDTQEPNDLLANASTLAPLNCGDDADPIPCWEPKEVGPGEDPVTISPAGNDDWFTTEAVNFGTGIAAGLSDDTTHPARADIYVDGVLVAGNSNCFISPSTGQHTVTLHIHDAFATHYLPGVFDSDIFTCGTAAFARALSRQPA